MITYSNIERLENIPFEDYLKIDALSHSFLKQQRNGITPVFNLTDNMRLGSLVDNIITEPEKANMLHPLYPAAKKIASTLLQQFGSMIKTFKKQVSYVGLMEYAGLTIKVKGRLDFLLEGFAIIDLKITLSKNINGLVSWMGYTNQVWHYAHLAGVKKAYIMIYSVPLDKTFIIQIDVSKDDSSFWEDNILSFGKAA